MSASVQFATVAAWLHNGRYYAQITLEEPKTGVKQVRRVPLTSRRSPYEGCQLEVRFSSKII